MWSCHKCGKPVYFAERKQSLGYDWHPECLRCEECGKRLNPGQHAEHKGVPYCHVPCYGALFGPQLFGHGTRVESHKSFGQQKETFKMNNGPKIPTTLIESKLKLYNSYFDGKSGEIRSREVNGRLILEGSLRIHWGVQGVIHLKENDDQRTVVTVRKRNSCRISSDYDSDEDSNTNASTTCSSDVMNSSTDTLSPGDGDLNAQSLEIVDSDVKSVSSVTLPSKLNIKNMEWDELDDLLQVERKVDENEKIYRTMPSALPSQSSVESTSSTISNSSTTEKAEDITMSAKHDESTQNGISEITETDTLTLIKSECADADNDCVQNSTITDESISSCDITSQETSTNDEIVRRSTKIKRRPGRRLSRSKIKRRCSINGHFYDRETSFFTPPHGSQMSVWVSSLVNTQEVINLMLEKYKVDSDGSNFALFIVRDNGEQKRLKDDEYPLLSRVLLGPHEDVARLFLMDSHTTSEVSNEVAQFLNFTIAECKGILNQYNTQEEREIFKVKNKYLELKRRIKQRMEELKVRL